MKSPYRILIVCTGNSCRSPIAEVLLRKRLKENNLDTDVEVLSAGTSAVSGMPASIGSVKAVKKHGASLEGFRSRVLSPKLCESADLVLVMEEAHREFIEGEFPVCSDKIRLLGTWLPPQMSKEIPDPVGGDQTLFDEITELIDAAILSLIEEWDSVKERFFNKQLIIAMGADHRGYRIKEYLKRVLISDGIEVIDCGTNSEQSCDHPDYAFKASELVASGKADRAILVCATGHGMASSANKVPGIRAVLTVNEEHAKLSRSHNNANVLAIGADFMTREEIEKIMNIWLNTDYLGGRYQRRINKISDYERSTCC